MSRPQRLAHLRYSADGGRSGGWTVGLLCCGSGHAERNLQGSQDVSAQARLGVGGRRQRVLANGQRLAAQVAATVTVQRVRRDVFRLVTGLCSGEFQTHAADGHAGLQVGPDTEAAAGRVVERQGAAVSQDAFDRLVGGVHHGESSDRTRVRVHRSRRRAGQRLLVVLVVKERHLHLDGQASVVIYQGVGGVRCACDIYAACEPLVAVTYVVQPVRRRQCPRWMPSAYPPPGPSR